MLFKVVTAAVAATLAVAGPALPAGGSIDHHQDRCDWSQFGQDAAHDGQVCAEGERGLRVLAHEVVDPFAEQAHAEFGGIPAHYPAPLTDSDGDVFMLEKGGSYVSCDPPGSGHPAPCGADRANIDRQTWTLRASRWRDGRLEPRWTFTSDWKPVPLGWEEMFQAALGDGVVYVPGAGGTVYELDKRSGRVQRRINPFGTVDPLTKVSGGLTRDAAGNLLYNVVHFDPAVPGSDARSWLVRAGRDGSIRTVDYTTLNPNAPKPTDLCFATFKEANPVPARPWPPAANADGSPVLPPRFPCLSQRPVTNLAPAIGPDGTIFVVTRPHSLKAEAYAQLLALRPNLTLRWATSLRGHLDDGCGVLVPYGTGNQDCRVGSAAGVDPATNLPPAGWASDFGSGSPTALPDGGVLFGAYTAYNGGRGHLMKFDRTGRFVADYDFGWDLTAAVQVRGRDYSVIIKDNHYATGGPYTLTKLHSDLTVDWRLADTSTQTCQRQPDGTISCVDLGDHPNGFEWCINAAAIDRNGTLYTLNADGFMYVVDRSGRVLEKVFLSKTIAAAYTPLSLDDRGRVYAQNNGELFVLGR